MFTNKTPNYDLPQWIATDKPTFLSDLNGAYLQIDTVLKANSVKADDAVTTATSAKNTADSAISSAQSNAQALITTNNNLALLNTTVQNMGLKTTTINQISAINSSGFATIGGSIWCNSYLNIVSIGIIFLGGGSVTVTEKQKLCGLTSTIITAGSEYVLPCSYVKADGTSDVYICVLKSDGIYWDGPTTFMNSLNISATALTNIID